MTIFHLIADLAPDGAQRCLSRLVTNSAKSGQVQEVIALFRGGECSRLLTQFHISLTIPGVSALSSLPRALFAVRRRLSRDVDPVVVAWMPHAIGLSILLKLFVPRAIVVWNIRTTPIRSEFSNVTWAALRLFGLLSRVPHRIVYNSSASEAAHRKIGYRSDRSVIIPNGLPLELFQRRPMRGAELRRSLGFSAEQIVFVYPKRVTVSDGEPWQAHFIRAAAKALEVMPDLRFVCVGRGVDDPRHGLPQLVRELALGDRLVLGGHVEDVCALMSASDIFVSTSRREGFPNAVIEAMACELPCIVCDAGDSRRIVAEHGAVVPFGDSEYLADQMVRLARLGKDALRSIGVAARQRVTGMYSIDSMVQAYSSLFDSLRGRSGTVGGN